MTRAFVTGGSGFVGAQLIATLRARGEAVVALARSGRVLREEGLRVLLSH